MRGSSRIAVDRLLLQYAQYNHISERQAVVARSLAKATLRSEPSDELHHRHAALAVERQSISDAMTFESPVIWMMYKFEAYAHSPQPIASMHDFRMHCRKPGYICTKRFDFVCEQLAASGHATWNDETQYPDDLSLIEASKTDGLRLVSKSPEFRCLWAGHEYYQLDGASAKWMNYPMGA